MTKIILIVAFLITVLPLMSVAAAADGTIIGGGNDGYAWSDQVGWVNFGTVGGAVRITDAGITGYAWNENYGWINLNPSTGGVLVAADGSLSGYAWGEGLGWINFSGVTIGADGNFSGQATGAVIGTLTFDCTHCAVVTDFVPQDQRADTGGINSSATRTARGAAGTESEQAPDAEPERETDAPAAGEIVPALQPPRERADDGVGATDPEPGAVIPVADTPSELPAQLFDITVKIKDQLIASSDELDVSVIFVSFGTEPTPVDVTFRILDDQGIEVYRFEGEAVDIIVETEGVLRQSFVGISLPEGKYTLVTETRYGDDVFDAFRQSFEIVAEDERSFSWWWLVALAVGFGLLLTLLLRNKKKR